MKTAVECINLTKSFGDEEALVMALKGVNFEMKTGELLMMVGPSGSGKTTLLSIISGILHQTSGECLIFGENINSMDQKNRTEFRKKNIGFIFQSLHLIPTLTAIENITIPLLLNGSEESEAREKASKLLEMVNLGHRMHALPSHMSGGEQQRVGICRGVAHNPRLIVCDEPTSTLDHDTGMKVLELLREIALDENKALIIVTHDPRIFDFADRILKMEDGQIIGEVSKESAQFN